MQLAQSLGLVLMNFITLEHYIRAEQRTFYEASLRALPRSYGQW